MKDFFLNGQAKGSVATLLLNTNFDVATLRPWVGNDGRSYIARRDNGKLSSLATPTANATLRHDEWKQLDDALIKVAKQRLNVVADLRAAGLTYSISNGMGKTVLMSEKMSDINPATISMDPARKGPSDRPEFDLVNLPLPVIHKDFFINARQLAASRNGGSPLDTTMAELAGRRVSEEIEKLALGTAGTFSYGGGTIYGLTNYPSRITAVLTAPTASAWVPATTVKEVLDMRQKSMDKFHYGPWVLYTAPAWDEYLDDDYSSAKGDNTLRQRIEQIRGIQSVKTADYLTGFQMLLVQQTTDVIREVIGMDMTTVQWETEGGMQLNFKVMAIMVPQLRDDANGNTGLVHGNVA